MDKLSRLQTRRVELAARIESLATELREQPAKCRDAVFSRLWESTNTAYEQCCREMAELQSLTLTLNKAANKRRAEKEAANE